MQTVHHQIAADAAIARSRASRGGPIPCTEYASLQRLIDRATDALFESLPASFELHGKTYRLMIDIQHARVAIFENMDAEKSMVVAKICMPDEQGGNYQGRDGHATN